MAIDNLGHAKDAGERSIPQEQPFNKLAVLDDRFLLASVGLVWHPTIGYKFEDWVTAFVEGHKSALPLMELDDLSVAIQDQMRKTFHRIEANPNDELWKPKPRSRSWNLVRYYLAGCARQQAARVCEISAELHVDQKRIEYHSPFDCGNRDSLFGSRRYAERASRVGTPENLLWDMHRSAAADILTATEIPRPLQELVARAIGMVKVEAHFNPDQVGMHGRVGVLQPGQSPYIIAF